ncbi:MAG: hypothetical protein GXY32_05940 [Ruminococcaceae bacterium]|nr:hypothetical protein [Oscillospiraceae bacterium]
MKKILVLCLALVLALSFAACGGGGTSGGGNSISAPASSQVSSEAVVPPASTPETAPDNNGTGEVWEWPDNAYTQQIPRPPESIKIGESYEVESQGHFTVQFSEPATTEELAEYAQMLQDSGFEGVEQTTPIYSFQAVNSVGYRVDLSKDYVIVTKPS